MNRFLSGKNLHRNILNLKLKFHYVLYLSVALFNFNSAWAYYEARNALKIHSKNGTNITILLDETPKISFQSDELVITSQKQTLSFPSSDVVCFTYEAVEATGINTASAYSGLKVSFVKQTISVSGLQPQTSVSIYTLDGILFSSSSADKHGMATLALPEVQGSVYVLKTSSLTLKIRKP